MLLRRVALENVRSFLERAELRVDGNISIIIGPNGGGKTNLLDTIVIILRRYIFASMYARHQPTTDNPDRYQFHHNDALNNLILERHSAGAALPQLVEVEIEVTARDLDNMAVMQRDAPRLTELTKSKYFGLQLGLATEWDLSRIQKGDRFIYSLQNGAFVSQSEQPGAQFLAYLNSFEAVNHLREEYELEPLGTPMIYLPVNRAANGFQASVQLASYNAIETKRQTDATYSRSGNSAVALAIGQLAQKYRLLLEKDDGRAHTGFLEDPNLKMMTELLAGLGYQWELICVDPLKNQYDVRLTKQGSSFLVGAASSGERELLTYLFTIFALNVRDALIVVDEPELHLHPSWQKTLLQMFTELALTTGNQFLLATHAPAFVGPESIQYVSRVFSQRQRSHILRLDAAALPDSKHLLNIVNSHNNESIFFADSVVLVEGISDRLFFEAVLDSHGRRASTAKIIEVISVGGKGFFAAYKKLLNACQVPFSIIADLDYVEQIGDDAVKALLVLNADEIKEDVIKNIGSLDGASLTARIDEAMRTGDWTDAQQIWEYIKSHRLKLKNDLTEDEAETLHSFVRGKYSEKIYVLEKGALEEYLPQNYKSKDLQKLIRLITENDFWNMLTADAKEELSSIARQIIAN